MYKTQHTLSEPITFTGTGLHSGLPSHITLHPAPSDHGIVFFSEEHQENIPAIVQNVKSTYRNTTIAAGKVQIMTIEHLMSVFAACQIDNVMVAVSGCEIPSLDGSALPFYKKINTCVVKNESERKFFTLKEPLTFHSDIDQTVIKGYPADRLQINVSVALSTGLQQHSISNFTNFEQEIAPARTFCEIDELAPLLEKGLIRGGDLSNALVIGWQQKYKSVLLSLAKKINIGEEILIRMLKENESSQRFENEPARHKLLDVIGDFRLLPYPITGRFDIYRPGHSSSIAFLRHLLAGNLLTAVTPRIESLELST